MKRNRIDDRMKRLVQNILNNMKVDNRWLVDGCVCQSEEMYRVKHERRRSPAVEGAHIGRKYKSVKVMPEMSGSRHLYLSPDGGESVLTRRPARDLSRLEVLLLLLCL